MGQDEHMTFFNSETSQRLQQHWSSLTSTRGTVPAALVIRPIEKDIDATLIARIGELGPRGIPPRQFGSGERRREWAEGRRCLLSLRDELKTQEADLEKIRSSLSHSQDCVIAVACASPLGDAAPSEDSHKDGDENNNEDNAGDKGQNKSAESAPPSAHSEGLPLKVGIDMEPADRSFHAGVPERIMHASEHSIDLEFLGFWVVKEACYKANPDSKGTVVGQYVVRSYDPATGEGLASCESSAHYQFHFRVVCEADWWIAMAVCHEVFVS